MMIPEPAAACMTTMAPSSRVKTAADGPRRYRSRRLAELLSRKRTRISKDLRVAAPVRLVLHLAFLLALSFLVFQSPETLPVNSILSLVMGRDDPLADVMSIEAVPPELPVQQPDEDRSPLAIALPESIAPVKLAVVSPVLSDSPDPPQTAPAPQAANSKPAAKQNSKSDPG